MVTFEEWMEDVKMRLEAHLGLKYGTPPRLNYRVMWEDGTPPHIAWGYAVDHVFFRERPVPERYTW
ncbi:MAG: hypothetical protein WC965_01085 [Thiohalomonadaceae bacterium]